MRVDLAEQTFSKDVENALEAIEIFLKQLE